MKTLLTNLALFFDRFYVAIGLGVVIILLTIGWRFVLGPQVTSLRERGLFELQTQRTALTQRQAELARLQRLQQTLAVLPPHYRQVASQVALAQLDAAEVFSELQKIASAAGVRLLSVSLNNQEMITNSSASRRRTVAADGAIQKVPLNFTVADLSYERLKLLLKHSEDSLHVYDISGLTYAPTTDTYTFAATTYLVAQ